LAAKILKGSAVSQFWPVLLFILLAARLVWRTGFGAGQHLDSEGYVELFFAAAVMAFACINLLMPATLSLDDRGLTWRSWRYSATYPWSAIDTFFLGPSVLGGKPKIAFNFVPGKTPSQVPATELNRSVNGFDRSMANVWKIPSDELVDLLNGYIRRSRGGDA
jgi:hypothetical protein